jgi:hypothetical protein
VTRAKDRRVNPHWQAGCRLVAADRLFGKIGAFPLYVGSRSHVEIYDGADDTRIPPNAWAAVDFHGGIYCNTRRQGTPSEWAYVVAHCMLHLCFGHFDRSVENHRAWNFAADAAVARFLGGVRFGTCPPEYEFEYAAWTRRRCSAN